MSRISADKLDSLSEFGAEDLVSLFLVDPVATRFGDPVHVAVVSSVIPLRLLFRLAVAAPSRV